MKKTSVPSQDAAATLKCKTELVPMWAMAKNNGAEELPMCAEEMSCANHILNTYEYTSAIEEAIRIPERGIDR